MVGRSCDSDVQVKYQKIDKGYHEYPFTAVEIEDDTTNYDALKQEVAKPNSKADILMNLMQRTFNKRWLWILESEPLVLKICEEYPPHQKAPYVRLLSWLIKVTIPCTINILRF